MSGLSQPNLRLVGDPTEIARWSDARRQRQAVIRENRKAAGNPGLEPTDPRWVLAARAQASLQSSALTPERRARLLQTANRLGLRPFDANLIIAIVQDHARRGESIEGAESTLAMVRRPQRERRRLQSWLRWIAVIATALAANALLIRWLLG